jgi:hypothetical protein
MTAPDRQQFRATLATLADKTKAKIPELNGRVEKALRLALAGDVELHEGGSATVYSSSDPTRRYEIVEGMCPCRDWEQAPQHLCQHRLSAGFVRKVHALLPTGTSAPAESAAADVQAPMVPLPEAPASVNVRLTIEGRECQLTLRDHDEARLLERLHAVLAQYPLAQPPSPPPQGEALPRCPEHGFLRKGKRGWYCPTKLADGSYCTHTAK